MYKATFYHTALCVFFVLLGAVIALGDGSPTGAAEYYRYDVGMQAGGMAGAVVSRIDNASAMYYNPSGLIRLPGVQLLGTFQDIGHDSYQGFLALALARQKWMGGKLWDHFALGFGWGHKESLRHGPDDRDDESQRSYIGDEGLALIALATRFPVMSRIDLSLGINQQVLYRDIKGTAMASSTSIGLQARLLNDGSPAFNRYVPLRLGLACLNCNKPSFASEDGAPNEVPRIVTIGLAYEISRDLFNQPATAALEWNLRSESGGSAVNMLGFEIVSEISGMSRLALRAGYAFDDKDFSLGLGFRIPLGRVGADVDILPARVTEPEFDQSSDIRLSTTLTYLGKKEEPADTTVVRKLPPIPDVIDSGAIRVSDTTNTTDGQ